ncbi:MAG TPA: NADH-quinone oxidoreductase subunit J [Gemmatimonadales bacterium]|nr:NADH-quinone oxidoreductase subunit J [Gemmatimonadales bacterium]
MSVTVFLIFGFTAIASALLCITRRSPIASALWLVITLFCIAALFVGLDAQFLAILQVLVYAGAIMVLFLFVIMLLNLGRPGPSDIKGPLGILVAVVLAIALLTQLLVVSKTTLPSTIQLPPGTVAAVQQQSGMVGAVAAPLFDAYLVPFEIASVLLLAAIVGAVVLAKRKL